MQGVYIHLYLHHQTKRNSVESKTITLICKYKKIYER
nr:MAG TPA: hypothetical protein [Caudoviricetes sp.]